MIEDVITTNVTFEGTPHSTASVPEIITTTKNTSRLIFNQYK
jgi:hypothetical protein